MARRYYLSPLPGPGRHLLPAPLSHHLLRVMRLNLGDRISLFDGQGRESRAELLEVGGGGSQPRLEVQLEEVASSDGVMDRGDLRRRLSPGTAAVIVQSPNFLGYLEDLTGLAEEVHAAGALLVQCADPLSLGALRSPASERVPPDTDSH